MGRPRTQTKVKDEEISLIEEELKAFTAQVNEILAAMKSIRLLQMEDDEARLKAIQTKVNISLKLPELLSALDDLRNKAKLKTESIRGSKNISLLESGALS